MRDPESSDDSSLSAKLIAFLANGVRHRRVPALRDLMQNMVPQGRREWAVALVIILLTGAIPLLTALYANIGRQHAIAARSELVRREAADLRAFAEYKKGRTVLGAALDRAGPAATTDRLAHLLPEESMLVSAESAANGALTLKVATNDPDRLRAAIRRDSRFRGLRDHGQVRGDGAMLVTLSEGR